METFLYNRFFRPRLCISSLGHGVSNYDDDEAILFMSGFFQELQRRKVYGVLNSLYHRCGIHHSNWFCGFSGMGIAELDAASCHRAFAGRFSGRAHSRLGLRHDAARNSSYPKGSWGASPPEYCTPRRRRSGNFYRCGTFFSCRAPRRARLTNRSPSCRSKI